MDIYSFGKIYLTSVQENYVTPCVLVKDENVHIPKFYLFDNRNIIILGIEIYNPNYYGHNGHIGIRLNDFDKNMLYTWLQSKSENGISIWKEMANVYNKNFYAYSIEDYVKKFETFQMPDYMLLPEK